MATLTKVEGFEHGTLSNAGYSICNTAGTDMSVSSLHAHSGSYALRCLATAAGRYTTFNIEGGTPAVFVLGFYFMFHDALPNADLVMYDINNAAGVDPRLYFESSDSKLYAAWGTTRSGVGSSAIEQDKWYRVDLRIDASANPNSYDIKVTRDEDDDEILSDNITVAQAATTHDKFYLGSYTGTVTVDCFFDDMAYSNTSGDYPLAVDGVEALFPTGEGTHNVASPTEFEDRDGADIDGAHPAWAECDGVPPDGTDFVQQDTADGTQAHYVEVTFGDTAHTNILGACAFCAYHGASAGTNNGPKSRIYDASDALVCTPHEGDWAKATVYWGDEPVSTPTGGWSLASINGLKGRFGYSNDVDPVPYLDLLLLQVAYGPDTGASPIGPTGNIASGENVSGTPMMRGTIQSEV